MKFEVVVVGAGGGGGLLGLALAQRGVRVCVVERQAALPTMLRAETIQPNGQAILDRLGILEALGPDAVQPVQRFHFLQIGGDPLTTIDYSVLPPPWNRALVTLANKVGAIILSRLAAQPNAELHYGMEFLGLLRRHGAPAGIRVRQSQDARELEIEADLVVGADGAMSHVRRALGINAQVQRYRHGYLLMLLQRPEGLQNEARYYLGRGELLGVFPAPGDRVVSLYMVEASRVEEFKARGLEAFRNRIAEIDGALRRPVASVTGWEQVGFLPCARVRAETWVSDRAVLIGDAAHAMNPHASQGRMQAMMDAMALTEVIMKCRETGNWSAEALFEYEKVRRPQVTMLQNLADEQTRFWNAGDPVRCFLRDRVFRGIDRNPRLRYQVLAATAGLRTTPPLTWLDRLMAVGLLPDLHANDVPLRSP